MAAAVMGLTSRGSGDLCLLLECRRCIRGFPAPYRKCLDQGHNLEYPLAKFASIPIARPGRGGVDKRGTCVRPALRSFRPDSVSIVLARGPDILQTLVLEPSRKGQVPGFRPTKHR